MLVFSVSDKGGTGRSVTSCNMAYRLSMKGYKVAYTDFDFGSPTAGGTFEISRIDNGLPDGGGLHDYLMGLCNIPDPLSVRSETDRTDLGQSRHPSGRLVLFPGDRGGAEFNTLEPKMVDRCVDLFAKCEREYDVTFIDLSAGRSAALQLVLDATRKQELDHVVSRWLVFHRWTSQHIAAARALVHAEHGILKLGEALEHPEGRLASSIRYVRTAVPELHRARDLRPAQSAWLQRQHDALTRTSIRNRMGNTVVLGQTPVEPMLQCREQVILDVDVAAKIANPETVDAFRKLADRLVTDAVWEGAVNP
ncbi:SCO2523 family variant P-loop protein [Nocardia sp. NBC_00511]|uniref:SCO2523 family variant P-loop protein n=1 Tax=Nocardia sp. NBC_00511 TaxID=2903591 RepID=UPI0030E03550